MSETPRPSALATVVSNTDLSDLRGRFVLVPPDELDSLRADRERLRRLEALEIRLKDWAQANDEGYQRECVKSEVRALLRGEA